VQVPAHIVVAGGGADRDGAETHKGADGLDGVLELAVQE